MLSLGFEWLSPVADLIAFCLGGIIAVACPCVTVRALM